MSDKSIKELAERNILKEIEKARIMGLVADINYLSDKLGISGANVREVMSDLIKRGVVRRMDKGYILTEKGRRKLKIGVISGVFDLIHKGHITALNEAKRKCDMLIVIIARDETVKKRKGRKPINNEEKRLYVVNSLKPVDLAMLGDLNDFKKPILKILPDKVFLGYDQSLPEEVREIAKKFEVERLKTYVPGESTTNLVNRIMAFRKEKREI